MADFYQTLGVSKSASADESKRAYRTLAHEHHPDKDKDNETKFKEIDEAYQVLPNTDNRAQYDRFGSNFQNNAGFNGATAQGFGGFDFSNFAQGFGQGIEFEDAFDIFSD